MNSDTDPELVELGKVFLPLFNENGLIPCIVVDHESLEVLMFAWMNREALNLTMETRKGTFYSRSRKKLWIKGESSGRTLHVRKLLVDCDQDVLQLRVKVEGEGVCHRGYRSCFYRSVSDQNYEKLEFVENKPAFDPDEVYQSGK
jgi:phosphoribosyl-AMP cyclohydrolase